MTPCPKCNKEKNVGSGFLTARVFYKEGRRQVELYCWSCGHTEPVR